MNIHFYFMKIMPLINFPAHASTLWQLTAIFLLQLSLQSFCFP